MTGKLEAIEADLAVAVGEILLRHAGGYPIKWLTFIEVLDDAGDRALWTFTSDALPSWDALGMVTHFVQTEAAERVAEATDGEEGL